MEPKTCLNWPGGTNRYDCRKRKTTTPAAGQSWQLAHVTMVTRGTAGSDQSSHTVTSPNGRVGEGRGERERERERETDRQTDRERERERERERQTDRQTHRHTDRQRQRQRQRDRQTDRQTDRDRDRQTDRQGRWGGGGGGAEVGQSYGDLPVPKLGSSGISPSSGRFAR